MQFSSILKRTARYIIKGIPEYNVSANIVCSYPSQLLEGKKIIITGGGRGLGLAMAKKFVSEGGEVLITGRNEANLKREAEGIGCKYFAFDITDFQNHASFINKANEMLEGANVLINNAGISLHESSFLEVSEKQFDDQFNTNLKGSYFLSQLFIKLCLKENRTANILFVSSERGDTVDTLPYGLTKACLNSLIKGLASKFIGRGIRINGIAPGVTASDMTGFNAEGNLFCNYNITKRVYLPEEVAEIAAFLISDNSAPLNGQILVCNEGKTVHV